MSNVKKIVLVTAKHLPQHKYFENIAKELANELNMELEILEEDYVFVNTYGEKDEFGLAWLPQLFAVMHNNVVKPILTKLPISERTLEFDIEKAKRIAKEALGLPVN